MTDTNGTQLAKAPSTPGSKEGAQAFLRKLRNADVPQTLVESLGPHDLLFAYREADEEQQADLLAMSTKEQFDCMVDLSCWSGYEPTIEKVLAFIEPLVSTGLGSAIRAFDKLGDELKTLLLKRHIVVYLREDKDEDEPWVPDTSDLIATADTHYFIEIPDSDNCPQVVKQLVQALLFKPYEEYQGELECIRHDLGSELEENALRWKNSRLADLGFGSYQESLVLLSPVDPSTVSAQVDKAHVPHPVDIEMAFPAVYRENIEGRELLDKSIEVLNASSDPQWVKRARVLPAELSAMTSLFLTAIKCDLGDLDAVAAGTRLARDVLALGLNAVSGNAPSSGAKALAYQVPGKIVQAGMGVLVPLRERARTLQKSAVLENGALLDGAYRVAVDSLANDIPLWWASLDGPESLSPAMPVPVAGEQESMDSVEKVGRASAMLDEIEKLEEILAQNLGWAGREHAETEDPIFASSIILTVLGNMFIGEDPSVKPVSSDDAERFATAFCDQPVEDAVNGALSVLCSVVGIDEDGPLEPSLEPDPARRALLRLLYIGRELLVSDPSNVLLTSQ